MRTASSEHPRFVLRTCCTHLPRRYSKDVVAIHRRSLPPVLLPHCSTSCRPLYRFRCLSCVANDPGVRFYAGAWWVGALTRALPPRGRCVCGSLHLCPLAHGMRAASPFPANPPRRSTSPPRRRHPAGLLPRPPPGLAVHLRPATPPPVGRRPAPAGLPGGDGGAPAGGAPGVWGAGGAEG